MNISLAIYLKIIIMN